MKKFRSILVAIAIFTPYLLAAQNPYMVKDINPGLGDGYPMFNAVLNGICYFNGNDGINGSQLWRSDGTSGGTYVVKSIYNGNMFPIDNLLYFSAYDATDGPEPWKSNGTANGTVMIKSIGAGSTGSGWSYWAKSGNIIFFNPCPDDWQL